nr:MAG TPA: tail component [Bacteriophage sp.]
MNLETYIVNKLDTLPELSAQIFPTAALVGDCEPPFAIYTPLSSSPDTDLAGDIMSVLARVRIDLYGQDYDALCALAEKVPSALRAENAQFGGMYIFYSKAASSEPDGFDLTMELHRKTLEAAIRYWEGD